MAEISAGANRRTITAKTARAEKPIQFFSGEADRSFVADIIELSPEPAFPIWTPLGYAPSDNFPHVSKGLREIPVGPLIPPPNNLVSQGALMPDDPSGEAKHSVARILAT